MKVLLVNEAGVEELLRMSRCVEVMRATLRSLALADSVLPLRSLMWLPDRSGLLGLMPGYVGEPRAFGIKVVTVMPKNHGTPYGSHQGVVLLFDDQHGQPLAMIDAAAITSIRTAAASAVATDVLALPEAGDLALLGSGVQARSHLEAMAVVRNLRRVRVFSRSQERARRFAETTRAPVPIEVMESAEAAVRGADLICATTSATEPVLRGEWLSPGAHLNAVGSCFPHAREIDGDAVRRARFFTDCRESCEKEAGDFLGALRDGVVEPEHLLGEIGEVLTARIDGRISRHDVTIYESLGIALEDVAAAAEIHRAARERGLGTWFEWGGPP